MNEEVSCQACGKRYRITQELRMRQLHCKCGAIVHRPVPTTSEIAPTIFPGPLPGKVKTTAREQDEESADSARRKREAEILAKAEGEDAWRRDHLEGGVDTSFHSDLLKYLLRFFRRM